MPQLLSFSTNATACPKGRHLAGCPARNGVAAARAGAGGNRSTSPRPAMGRGSSWLSSLNAAGEAPSSVSARRYRHEGEPSCRSHGHGPSTIFGQARELTRHGTACSPRALIETLDGDVDRSWLSPGPGPKPTGGWSSSYFPKPLDRLGSALLDGPKTLELACFLDVLKLKGHPTT